MPERTRLSSDTILPVSRRPPVSTYEHYPHQRSRRPRILVDRRVFVVEQWVGLGDLESPRDGHTVHFEPTFRLESNSVVLSALEPSDDYGYRSREEAGEVGAPIPFSGRLLASFTAQPWLANARADWLPDEPSAVGGLLVADDVQEVVFHRGRVEMQRALADEFSVLRSLLGQRSRTSVQEMLELVGQTPFPGRAAREARAQAEAQTERDVGRWAREVAIDPAYHIEPRAVYDVMKTVPFARDPRPWAADRPRASRNTERPWLEETSAALLASLDSLPRDGMRAIGTCPRCRFEGSLRVCEGRFVLCDDCWLRWW